MTVFLTVFAGVVTFVVGQLVLVLVIHPIQEFRRTVADIAHAKIERANVYANPNHNEESVEKQVSQEFRKLSSRLFGQMHLIPRYELVCRVLPLPSRDNMYKATKELIALSHFRLTDGTENSDRAETICDLLGIRTDVL